METLTAIAFIGLAFSPWAIAICLGWWPKRGAPSDEGYWQAIAGREEKKAETNWSRFVDACRECNTIEEELQDALASNRRLTDALQAKNERLERIVEAFEGQQSGTAQKAVRMARGDC